MLLLASHLTNCADLKQAPTASTPVVSALVVDAGDELSSNFPQIHADVDVQVSGEFLLPSSVPDANTGAPIDRVPFSTPVKQINVTSGWTSAARAILRITGPDGVVTEALPTSSILRGSVVNQYGRNGDLVSNVVLGRHLDGPSPAEWFASRPVTVSTTALPVGGVLSGGLTLSDSAMAATGATVYMQASAGTMLPTAKLSLPASASMRREARYVKIRSTGVGSGAPVWVLREMRLRTVESTSAVTRIRGVQRLRVKRVTLQEPFYSGTSTAPIAMRRRLFIIPEEPDPWAPEPTPPPPPAPEPTPPSPPPAPPVPAPTLPANTPVVFQHGYLDNKFVWDPMRDTLRRRLSISDEAFSLNAQGDLASAGSALQVSARARFNAPTVFVAHSAGGLLARYAGNIDPALVAGIVTVGTPHTGALIADRGPVAAGLFVGLLSATFVTSPCLTNILNPNGRVCTALVAGSTGLAGFLVGLGLGSVLTNSASDLKPSAAFVQGRNLNAEVYPRVGITHRVNNRWAAFRMLSESRAIPLAWNSQAAEEGALGASAVFQSALFTFVASTVQLWMLAVQENSYSGLRLDGSCGPIFSDSFQCSGVWQDPWARYAYSERWQQYLLFFQTLSFDTLVALESADELWNWATTDWRAGDGFIGASSQAYPNTPGSPFPPLNFESVREPGFGPTMAHNGEPRSKQVEERIRRSMISILLVQQR